MVLNVFAAVNWTVGRVFISVLDIAILTFIIYRLLLMIRGTRAIQLIEGLLVLLVIGVISGWMGLSALSWVFDQIWGVVFVSLAVIFQPELRRALEQLGRGQMFKSSTVLSAADAAQVIDEITSAVVSCAKTKTGVLIVIERSTGLNDYAESGIAMDATVSAELLCNIFVKNTPLHDGATVIRGSRVMAAACFLPLSDNPYLSMELGTRHRAAIGITEVSDAISVIVSEETGIISLARDGKLVRSMSEKQLRDALQEALIGDSEGSLHFWQRRLTKHG
ncbi:MAG: diadenylate cyclase CdaA [Firmicutes bacterium]|nr:diadenylate cyclase CdaA [Bacillota bacterium]MBQ6841703.1 diadenylate cyclase CdaA [Bacillota bacterium]